MVQAQWQAIYTYHLMLTAAQIYYTVFRSARIVLLIMSTSRSSEWNFRPEVLKQIRQLDLL
jgi:hypothetical protein